MKNIQELEKYIKFQAEEHADEDELYELIELCTYQEIMKYCLARGFTVENIDFDFFINGIDEENEEIEDKSSWYYFIAIQEFIEDIENKDKVPSYVKHLHDFWMKEFWPEYEKD